MWLYGNPDDISQFNTNPDRQLTSFNGNWYDYIKSYLFNCTSTERYGGQAAMQATVAEPLNSIAGYDAVPDHAGYTQNFEDVFSDWVVANHLTTTPRSATRFALRRRGTLAAVQSFRASISTVSGRSDHDARAALGGGLCARYLNGSAPPHDVRRPDNNSTPRARCSRTRSIPRRL